MDAELLGYLADSHPFSDDGQDGVITLFHLAELPEHRATSCAGTQVGRARCRTSTEYVSGITRTRVGDHPETKCRASPGTTHFIGGPPGSRSRHLGIKRAIRIVRSIRPSPSHQLRSG